jgi:hypothetical protein
VQARGARAPVHHFISPSFTCRARQLLAVNPHCRIAVRVIAPVRWPGMTPGVCPRAAPDRRLRCPVQRTRAFHGCDGRSGT